MFLYNSKFFRTSKPLNLNFLILSVILDNQTRRNKIDVPELNLHTRFLGIKNIFEVETKKDRLSNFSFKTENILKHKPQQTFSFYLNLFILVNRTSNFSATQPHANYRLFYLHSEPGRVSILNPTQFFRKWSNSYEFLFNAFYFQFEPFIFSSKFFKKETLALNWSSHLMDITTWRYTSFFFTFFITVFTRKLQFFYKYFQRPSATFALITDLEYHFKTLFYLKRHRWFTLALVPINLDPWLVSFAVPVFKNDLFVQFFFIKILLLIRRQGVFHRFEIFKNFWVTTQLSYQKYLHV